MTRLIAEIVPVGGTPVVPITEIAMHNYLIFDDYSFEIAMALSLRCWIILLKFEHIHRHATPKQRTD